MEAPKTEKTRWTSVNIPKDVIEKIRRVGPRFVGYKSSSDYVLAAVLRKLELDEARLYAREDEGEKEW